MSARRVLVTGASRGVGRAVAAAFAAAGDRVAVHHRDSADLAESLRAELPGSGHVVVRADLADPDAVAAMVDAAANGLGGLDVLVNNAGQAYPHPITDVSYEQWQQTWARTLAVNLTGPANVTWCAVRHMLARPEGSPPARIVNVGSRGAYRGEPGQPAYGAAKAGLHAMGQSLAVALAPHGISVASVAPGYVLEDPSNASYKVPRGFEHAAQSPFHRVARPDEVAAAVLWLASAEAEWASGAVLDLNGASHLR
ncbi:SDR family NAD(P)-dependent oxidoreductase [Catellatospora tritici]|uniref:SDR family NAD(P)-dependent oxidoreductase n=1 Tax=Catellatospora tritici TaxID=2851566 RepID=UPI001C2D5AA1|nr:SDR family oxidoreductase [Catellatospora tritici]MBV1855690.1 SDR family oxidoreductase [Catellatospora tritici]